MRNSILQEASILAKKLTIRDIAEHANVSYSSVSRALSGSPGVSDATRKKVLALCTEMGYTTNFTARSLVAKESRLLGLLVGNIDNPFCNALASCVENRARAQGYNLLLCSSGNLPEQEIEMFRLLTGRMVDGIILAPAEDTSCQLLAPYLEQVPTLFVGEVPRDARVNYVTTDYLQGMQQATNHLLQLGHTQIAYIGRRLHNATHQLRAEGYIAAMTEQGLPPIFFDNPTLASSLQEGKRLAEEMLALGQNFSAVVAATDMIALGVMQAADEAGLSIPKDLSLISFDDIPFAALPRINLTTVNQPTSAMGETAVDLLLQKIQNPTIGYTHQVLPPTLAVRGSCAAPLSL